MSKWIVDVTLTSCFTVEVEADGWGEARAAAAREAPPGEVQTVSSAMPRQQLGEPWVHGGRWYMDRPQQPSDVIVFKRAHGHTFTEADIGQLAARLAAVGLDVLDSWNGAGCSTASFRCGGRNGDEEMSEERLAVFQAPRPYT